MVKQSTWAIVADGAQGSIFSYEGVTKGLVPIENGVLRHKNQSSGELTTNDKGGGQAGYARSGPEWTSDPHENEKVKFADEIADFLTAREAQFSKLMIAAAPKMLGYLRKSLPVGIQNRITLEVPKDLTKLQVQELNKHFDSEIAVSDQKIDHFNKKRAS